MTRHAVNDHPTLRPWTLLGYRRNGMPIYQIGGGAPPQVEAEPDEEEDEAETDDAEQDDAGNDTWKPPTREQWDRTQAAIKRNNAENRKVRQLKKRLTDLGVDDLDGWLADRGIDPTTGEKTGQQEETGQPPQGQPPQGQPPQGQPEQPPQGQPRNARQDTAMAARRAEERGVARAELKYKPVVAELAAENMLRAAGWQGENMSLVMKLVDLDDVDIDPETRKVVGLDEQIENIKAEFPEWFTRRRRRAAPVDEEEQPQRQTRKSGARDVDGGDRRTGPAAGAGWLQQIDNRLKG